MDETAWEEAGRGLFTSALIKALSQIDINNTTYKDLMKRISIPPKYVYISVSLPSDLTSFQAKSAVRRGQLELLSFQLSRSKFGSEI